MPPLEAATPAHRDDDGGRQGNAKQGGSQLSDTAKHHALQPSSSAARAAIADARITPSIKILNLKPFEKNTLKGFFDLELADSGMILRGCTLHDRDGKRWIGYPGRPCRKDDGAEGWANIIDFVDNKAKYSFAKEALPHVLRAFAEAGR
jgi:hypothetical protein